MAAAAHFFPKKKALKSTRYKQRQPMEIIKTIKEELAKSGMESCFIGKKVEDLLARVYFPSVN